MAEMWETPAGDYLLQGALEPLPLRIRIELPNGEQIDQAAPYYRVSAAGQVRHVYSAPIAYSLDDALGIANIHTVIDGCLYTLHWIDNAIKASVVESRLELANLVACSGERLPFDPRALLRAYEQRT